MGQLGEAVDSQGRRTTPETAQQIIAGQYTNSQSNPILTGGQVTGTATLAYHVAAGVGVIKTAAGAKYVTWDETDTALTTPPETGTATDTIFADADGVIHVTRDNYIAGCVLDKRTITAGATATSSTTSSYDRRYATPYGARLGELAYWQENAAPGTQAAGTWTVNLSFSIPSDRGIELEICQELKTYDSGELNPGAILWSVSLDGGGPVRFELPVDRRKVLRQQNLRYRWVLAGRHTFTITRKTQWLRYPDTRVVHFGGGDGYQVGYYRVQDMGPVE
ncbi:hypothetical protein [Propionibacterium australiense]|uniref:Uncharacterized protein n=1 Tax=Propionibacterium australiense TaxID=119981 RepID=A0A8B3FLP3_9ACTN|nr:hypothetical protein [Propionibacterium australiense]RLP08925.1 hypothetical protein D7U36_08945 [Propionibacterium australiense]